MSKGRLSILTCMAKFAPSTPRFTGQGTLPSNYRRSLCPDSKAKPWPSPATRLIRSHTLPQQIAQRKVTSSVDSPACPTAEKLTSRYPSTTHITTITSVGSWVQILKFTSVSLLRPFPIRHALAFVTSPVTKVTRPTSCSKKILVANIVKATTATRVATRSSYTHRHSGSLSRCRSTHTTGITTSTIPLATNLGSCQNVTRTAVKLICLSVSAL
mmetsp:Transcript_32855/g.75140  ORF Transcript_32855/g.75140 Transcript_32855/m.75140 type:complete len:214 (+) Transcript_32855:159-800(+)